MQTKLKNLTRKTAIILMALQGLATMGCTPSLTLQTQVELPVPLTAEMPLSVAVHYSEAFRNYAYTENSDDRANWNIQCGASQVVVFDRVLSALFATVVQVDGTSYQGGHPPDMIFVPEVEDMQFALPQETHTDLYEAWIKYRIMVYYPDGQPIGVWPVSGYGKTSTELFKGRDEGLNIAINAAFRDIGAKVTLGFAQSDVFKQWQGGRPAGLQP